MAQKKADLPGTRTPLRLRAAVDLSQQRFGEHQTDPFNETLVIAFHGKTVTLRKTIRNAKK